MQNKEKRSKQSIKKFTLHQTRALGLLDIMTDESDDEKLKFKLKKVRNEVAKIR